MKFLTIIRHAKSSWAESGQPDHERPLNARGRLAAPAVGRFLAHTYFGLGREPARMLPPEMILTSTAARTAATAEALRVAFALPEAKVQLEPKLYLAERQMILRLIRELDENLQHAVLVGHNPGLHEFCDTILSRASIPKMPTCTAVVISLPIAYWGLADFGSATLIGHITPKALERQFPSEYAGISNQGEED
jgi:phosphohistidine phosphatase